MSHTIKSDDWSKWVASLHEAGHVAGFCHAGVLPEQAWADSSGVGETIFVGPIDDEEKLQIAAISGMAAVDTFTNETAASLTSMSQCDRRLFNKFDKAACADSRIVRQRFAAAQTLCLAHERFILKIARHCFEHRSISQSQIAYLIRTTGSSARAFRHLTKGIQL